MIKTNEDFSETTLKVYNDVKLKNESLYRLIDILWDNDYPKNEILDLVKKEFKSDYKFIKEYLN